MQAQRQPLPEVEWIVPTGLFLITEDGLGVAAIVAAALEQRGAQTVLLPSAALKSATALEGAIAQYHPESITGIVHLAALAPLPQPETLVEWREYSQIHIKSLFQLLKQCASNWQPLSQAAQTPQPSRYVLAASLLGGHFGRGQAAAGLATGGAASGFLKTLVAEWSGVQAKAIDFNASLSPDTIAEAIMQELLAPGGSVEVGYPEGQRMLFKTVPAPVNPTARTLFPAADWVVLVTGGARGITAEVMKSFLVPGMRLILVGRSPEPEPEPESLKAIEDSTRLRQVLIEQARASGKSLTPVQIEKTIQGILRDRDIRRHLTWFRQQGTVEYWSMDVRDDTAFSNLLQHLYSRYGRLDAVIHGAGLIEDKLIADKQLDSFERVYHTKVDSAFLLSRYLQPASLKLLVFFSSVAGRYGNRGQSDYAAANEVVNRLAWQLADRWSTTRVVALNWGPWDTTGMASDSVKRQFRERGIIPIPLRGGQQFFLDELHYGQMGDTEIVAGTGPWSDWEALQESFTPPRIPSPQVLLSTLPTFQSNSTVTLQHTFCLDHDPYLWDHRLDGNLVLPAAAAAEWFAEFVQTVWTDWVVTEIRDLRVLRGLVVEKASRLTVLLRGRASSHANAESLEVLAEILDAEGKRPFYRATVVLQPELSQSPLVRSPLLTAGTTLDPVIAYQDYLFHGPDFQLIQAIDCINPQGSDAWVMPSSPQIWKSSRSAEGTRSHPSSSHWAGKSWLFDPGLLDTAPQLAIVWARVQHQTTALPSRFGSITRYGSASVVGPLRLLLRIKEVNFPYLVYDALFIEEGDRLRLQLTHIESTCNPALNRLAKQE